MNAAFLLLLLHPGYTALVSLGKSMQYGVIYFRLCRALCRYCSTVDIMNSDKHLANTRNGTRGQLSVSVTV